MSACEISYMRGKVTQIFPLHISSRWTVIKKKVKTNGFLRKRLLRAAPMVSAAAAVAATAEHTTPRRKKRCRVEDDLPGVFRERLVSVAPPGFRTCDLDLGWWPRWLVVEVVVNIPRRSAHF